MVALERRTLAAVLAAFFLFLFVSPAAHAQAVAVAEVTGAVTDPSGAAVVGATVNMVEAGRSISHAATADSAGRFVLPNLPVGPYRLEVASPGFKTHVQTGITLQVNDHIVINVPLQVGAVSESVEVVAAAAMVQTAQNSVSQVVDQQRITELPLNGRAATDLVVLSGAAQPLPTGFGDMMTSKTVVGGIAISVAGGQAQGTNYLLDGGSHVQTTVNLNLPFPFPDALQEFSVETSALPARNGTQSGGVVNAVTKAGSNQLHGNLFEFVRNGNMNARNYFAAVHDSVKRNQFGGTLGGPIIKDKLFFFGGYQSTRNRQAPPETVSFIPTAAALGGDFSTMLSPGCQSSKKQRLITDPLNGLPFANSQVPTSRYDPASIKLMKYLPATGDLCGKVVYGIPAISNEDQYIGRVDWFKSAKHSVFGRYFLLGYSKPQADPTGNYLITILAGNQERVQTITLGETWTVNPTTINSAHATFNRVRNDRGPNDNQINSSLLGVNVYNPKEHDLYLTVSNAFQIGCGQCGPGFFNVNTWQFADDVDMMRGKHQMAFGASFMRSQNNLLAGVSQNPAFTFNGSTTGDSNVDLMLGYLSGFIGTKPEAEALRMSMPALYFQDTYRANSRLVINAGVRWQPSLFPVDVFHRGSTFSVADFVAGKKSQVFTNAPVGSLFYGDPGVPSGFVENSWATFSPRVGIVWDPKGDGKQTIRVGSAMMYDSGNGFYPQRVMSNSPYGKNIQLYTSAAKGFSDPWVTGYNYPGGNPFPGVYPPPKDVLFPETARTIIVPTKMRPMYVTQWNLSYQRQITENWMVSASYLGNKTTHLWSGTEWNPTVFIPGTCSGKPCSSTANDNIASRRILTRLNPSQGKYYGQLSAGYDGANANYNGLLVSAQHRLSGSFTLLANYTWSHCISLQDRQSFVGVSLTQDVNNFAAERGSCVFDVRHSLNISGVITSPVKGKSWSGRLLGNWQVAPMIRANSGMPILVQTGTDNSLTAIGYDRPNVVQPSNVYTAQPGPSLQWLNPTAFAANPLGTFGNLGRNAVTGPSQFRFDAAVTRGFDITERLQLDVRAESFNVLNHTSFMPPSGILSSSVFGRIQNALDPRIMQLAMKLRF